MSLWKVSPLLLYTLFLPLCTGAVYGGSARPNHSSSDGLRFQEHRWDGGVTRDSTAPSAAAVAQAVGEGYDEDEGAAKALRGFASACAMKTGTTIAGVIFKGGVMLGADTRATGGRTVCDRNCDKIHILASNIACCGAGTSADAVRITEGARLALERMAREMQACLPSRAFPFSRSHAGEPDEGDASDKEILFANRDSTLDVVQRRYLRVAAAACLLRRHLFRYQGMVSAALVLGGVDATGEHIYQIHEGGSFAEVDYTAMGSGSLAALSALERGYRNDLTEEEAKVLVLEAIAAGIDNDLGSGSNIDLCVITAERGLEHQRGAWQDPGLGNVDQDAPIRSLTQGKGALVGEDETDSDDDNGDNGNTDDAGHRPAGVSGISVGRADGRGESKGLSDRQQSLPQANSMGLENRQDEDELLPGANTLSVDVGGDGGSRAWVGSVRRRRKLKSVVRVDHQDNGALKNFRCTNLDDKVEII